MTRTSRSFDRIAATVPRELDYKDPASNRGSLWRKEDPEIDPDTKEVLKGGMFSYQRKWYDLKNFIHLFVGGYGAGKTLIGAKKCLAVSLTNAPVPSAIVSPTYKVARETSILTLRHLLRGKQTLLGRGFQWQFKKNDGEFVVYWHGREARMLVYSGEEPENLKGPNIGYTWIDEPFVQKEEVFHQMVSRTRHPAAKVSGIGLSGTPEQLNWGYDLAAGELGQKHDVGMVVASTRANTALPSWYVPNLEASYSGKAATAYIEGGFVSLSKGQVYYGFDPLDNVVCREVPVGAEWGVGMDFNVNPMAFVVFWKFRDQIHFVREYEIPNADTEYACSLIREEWGDKVNDVYPDASGNQRHTNAPGGVSDFWFIRRARFQIHCNADNPPLRDRENAANGMLSDTNGRIRATIDPSCKKLQKYLSLYNHEEKNKDEQKAMSHLLDAATYPIAFLFPVDHPSVRVKRLHGA